MDDNMQGSGSLPGTVMDDNSEQGSDAAKDDPCATTSKTQKLRAFKTNRQRETLVVIEQIENDKPGRAYTLKLGHRSDELGPMRKMLHDLLKSRYFDSVLGLIIVANAFTIGIETHYKASKPLNCDSKCKCDDAKALCYMLPDWVIVADYSFTAIYIVELSARFTVFGIAALKSNWIKFDAISVFVSVLDLFLLLISIETNNPFMENLVILRMARLARLARALRLVALFRVLWQLVQGLMRSIKVLVWTFIMLGIMVSIFSILFLEVVEYDLTLPLEHPYNVQVRNNFADIQDTLAVLFQAFSFDDVAAVYRPMIHHNKLYLFLFMAFLLWVSIALLNLVTAIMVEGSLEQGNEDKESLKQWERARKKAQMEELKAMFKELDEDGSGELSLDEIESAPEEMREQLVSLAGTDDIESLFQMLDYDDGGSLGTDEFCDGVMKASNKDRDNVLELSKLLKQNKDILTLTRQANALVRGEDLEESSSRPSKDVVDNEDSPQPQASRDPEVQAFMTKIENQMGQMDGTLQQMKLDVQQILDVLASERNVKVPKGGPKRAVVICRGPSKSGQLLTGQRKRMLSNDHLD